MGSHQLTQPTASPLPLPMLRVSRIAYRIAVGNKRAEKGSNSVGCQLNEDCEVSHLNLPQRITIQIKESFSRKLLHLSIYQLNNPRDF